MPIVGAPSTTAQLILDPVTEDAANVEVELTDDNNYGLIAHSYPTPPLAAQWASSVSTEGAVLASQRHENRVITISVDTVGLGALYDLEQKITKLYREGGTLKRTFADSREIVFDILTVQDYDATFEQLHHLGGVTPVTITLVCKPYGRGAAITLSDHVETTLPVLVFTETDIPGDIPALGDLIIDEDQAQPQEVVHWGLESRYYSASSTAALFWQAESCTMQNGTVTGSPPATASGGSGVVVDLITAGAPTSILTVGPAGGTTHRGSFRVLARVQAKSTNTGNVSMHVLYSGWQAFSAATAPVTLPTIMEGTWIDVDLGVINVPAPPAGVTSGNTFITLYGTPTVANDDLYIDWVLLIPCLEGSGIASGLPGLPFNHNGAIEQSQHLRVRYDGVFSGGTTYRRAERYEGDYLRVPPSGPEGRTVRFVVKGARPTVSATTGLGGDIAIDDISARLTITPRFLVVPDA